MTKFEVVLSKRTLNESLELLRLSGFGWTREVFSDEETACYLYEINKIEQLEDFSRVIETLLRCGALRRFGYARMHEKCSVSFCTLCDFSFVDSQMGIDIHCGQSMEVFESLSIIDLMDAYQQGTVLEYGVPDSPFSMIPHGWHKVKIKSIDTYFVDLEFLERPGETNQLTLGKSDTIRRLRFAK